MVVTPNKEQADCLKKISEWFRSSDQVFVLAGYAGTGKSTIAAMIAGDIGVLDVYYCAYTGKAANVLREKGCLNVDTIHGWLYDIKGHSKKHLEKLVEAVAEAELNSPEKSEEARKQLSDFREKSKQPNFKLNMDSSLKHAKLIIVDEWSMLPDKIIKDLLKVGSKILFVGDPYQLPPVNGECSLKPDLFLEQIHRQAENSSIIRFSKIVREGGAIPMGDHGDLRYIKRADANTELFTEADQLIVGKNITRASMNKWYREKLGYSGYYPNKGEKVICLKNNHAAGLFNGMIGEASKDAKGAGLYFHLSLKGVGDLKVFAPDIRGGVEYDYRNKVHAELERFTFGYAITCHKSQGSEFDNLVIINEPVGTGEGRRRWLYTAITRASKKCALINPN